MIREINALDIDEVNKLLKKFNYKITEEDLKKDFFKSLIYVDKTIKGVIIYSLIYDRIEIEYIITSEDSRRNGIGTKLLKEIEKHNVKNISLEVRTSNDIALNFYKNNGYLKKAIRKNYYKNEDAYLMIKELGE